MRFVSVSHELRVSSWPDGKETHHYKPRSAENLAINTVSLGKNGAWVLFSQSYAFAEIVSLGDSEAKHLNSIQSVKNTTCADFQNTSSRRIALGTSSGQLLIYDLKSKCIKQQCPTLKTQYFKVQNTIKDTNVLGACKDGRVYVYRTNSGNLISTLSVPNSQTVTNFRCHPIKTNLVGLCSGKGTVAMWDYNVEKPTASYEAHRAAVADVLLKNELILSIGADKRLSVLDYRAKRTTLEMSLALPPTAFDLHGDGVNLAVALSDGQVYGFDMRSMAKSTQVLAAHTSRVNQILFDSFSSRSSTSAISEEMSCEALPAPNKPEQSFSAIYCDANSLNANEPQGKKLHTQDSFLDALSLFSDTEVCGDASSVLSTRRSLRDSKMCLLSPHAEVDKREPPKSPRSKVEESGDGEQLDVPVLQHFQQEKSEEATGGTPAAGNATNINRLYSNLKASTPINNANLQSPLYASFLQSGGAMMREEDLRRILREELEAVKKELWSEVQDEIFELRYHMQQATLTLQWSINKMRVEFEEQMDRLRHDLLQPDASL